MRTDKDWDNEELRATVEAYVEMLEHERAGRIFVKKQYCKKLAQAFGRSEKAYESRMQNISYVLSLIGRNWLMGVKPTKNVGADIAVRIEALLEEIGGYDDPPVVAFEIAVREEANQKNLAQPDGVPTPKSRRVSLTQFERDPLVQAWVLQQAKGVCEGCERPAPFRSTDGLPYLELHYLRPLAEGGGDTVTNAVALCPNCHREIHHGANAQALIAWLYDTVARLMRR
ncbi:MAG TPA: HNH endonuclease [Nitrosospira sp.]|nr:HNH endonuclease [Nitrosospira sp.]